MAVMNAHLLLDLEMVVLGGGMANAGASLGHGVEREFRKLCPKAYQGNVKVRISKLGDAAGVVGAGLFARDHA
jgi:predicted NBD/HSP70 family sugar kinase